MLESAERAASLTHQLLTFSRQQVVDAQALDMNAISGSLASHRDNQAGVLCLSHEPTGCLRPEETGSPCQMTVSF
jgi:hypothetical protein